MIKVNIYRGIEYIRISDLPIDQKKNIKNWINPELVIKIQTEEDLLSDCMLYKDYEFWYHTIFSKSQTVVPKEVKTYSSAKGIGGLAFD